MSVPKSKRGISSMEFYAKAKKIRKAIERRILQIASSKALRAKTPQEQEILLHQLELFQDAVRSLTKNINYANTIYIKDRETYSARYNYQTLAIASCYDMLDELEHTVDLLGLSVQEQEIYIKEILQEISILKGWRQQSNKVISNNKNVGQAL